MHVRVGSHCHACACVCPGTHLAFQCVQTLTCPLCPGDQLWAPSPGEDLSESVGSCRAALPCVVTSCEPWPPRSTCSFSSISDQILGLQGARCLAVFCPAFSPQNDLPASTPASKSCDSSPPQDASTPGPSSASHLRQLAAKPTPSTDSIGERPPVPARAGLLSGREVLESGRG